MKTLEQILEKEQGRRHESGNYGIIACKKTIEATKTLFNEGYYQQLEKYVQRANSDIFFNDAMVLACWELINGK